MLDNMKTKEQLFSKVEKLKATGNHNVDKTLLQQSFGNENTVVYSFCKGCATILEMDINGARKLSNQAGIEGVEIPDSFEGNYFETGGCETCDSEDQTVFLKEIN
jgi:hypothetical protein